MPKVKYDEAIIIRLTLGVDTSLVCKGAESGDGVVKLNKELAYQTVKCQSRGKVVLLEC